jgi:predicted nucleic acid-binding Zn ribbon protein
MPLRAEPVSLDRFCVVCQNPIPADRKVDAVTCSKECGKKRKDYMRATTALRSCKYCQRPATIEERARYAAWRRWEKAGQSDENSAVKLLRENAHLKRKLAELAPHEELAQTTP